MNYKWRRRRLRYEDVRLVVGRALMTSSRITSAAAAVRSAAVPPHRHLSPHRPRPVQRAISDTGHSPSPQTSVPTGTPSLPSHPTNYHRGHLPPRLGLESSVIRLGLLCVPIGIAALRHAATRPSVRLSVCPKSLAQNGAF